MTAFKRTKTSSFTEGIPRGTVIHFFIKFLVVNLMFREKIFCFRFLSILVSEHHFNIDYHLMTFSWKKTFGNNFESSKT